MKELSIEEKAKRYDEAIKVAKSSLTYPNYPGFIRADVVFPELKESEDDRIRRWLICGMNALKEQKNETFATIPIDDAIAWLEKQGEKSVDCLNSIKGRIQPQKQWKPSDEHIKAIRLARSFVVDDFGEHPTLSEILMELEEQLQKIKENKLSTTHKL